MPGDAWEGGIPFAEAADGGASPGESLLVGAEEIYRRGEIDSAQALFRTALNQARRQADPSSEAEALTSLGLAAWRLGDYGDARRLGEEALDLKLRLGLQGQLFRSYNALGLLAWNESRYHDAIELYGRALDHAEADADSINLVKVWTNLGLVHADLGDFAESRRLLLKALPLARQQGDGLIEGRVLTNLGMLAVRTGDPLAGIAYLREGLARAREVGDPVAEQNALGQLGSAYAVIGELGRAIAHVDSALRESRIQGLRQEEASDLELLADLYRDAGDFRRALHLYEKAKEINEELGFDDETGTDLRSQADIHATLGNLEIARRLAAEALAIHQRVGARMEGLGDLLLLADLSHQAGRKEEAVGHLESARHLAENLEVQSARSSVALAAARIADREGDSGDVLRILAAQPADPPAVGHDGAWERRALLARAYARAGDLEAAATEGRGAIEAIERVRGAFASRILQTSYLAERDATYHQQVETLLRLGRTEEALEVADAARGRALVEHRATLRANGGETVRELAEEERQILRQIDVLTLQVEEIADSTGEAAAAEYRVEVERLYAELDRTRADYAAALVRAEEREANAIALLGGKRPSAMQVKAALDPDEALLEFLISPNGILLFVVTDRSVRTFENPVPRPELAMRVRLARELLGRPGVDPEAMRPVLTALHGLLLGPVLQSGLLKEKKALILIPHGELHYVPFAALRNPRSGRYVAQDFSLLHLPSAGALPVLRQGSGSPEEARRPVAFAPFPRDLPHTAREADALRESLGGERPVLEGRATEGRFRRALAEAGIVHAATHGILNARNPLFSRLEFVPDRAGRSGEDGRLEVHELVSARIRASLVFLSGCETGVGASWSTAFGRGEDYATLSRAFLYAGAANVVATLWRVEDEGAAVFARSFYGHLAARGREAAASPLSIPSALALAQREMIEDPSRSAPYYWAGYRVSGSGEIDASLLPDRRPLVDWLKGVLSIAVPQGSTALSVLESCSGAKSLLRRCA